MRLLSLISLLALAAPFTVSQSSGGGILAIDYGTSFFKASLIRPGTPFDVLLNKDSKRKTESTVAVRWGEQSATMKKDGDEVEGEKTIGREADGLSTRFPLSVYPSIKLLLSPPSSISPPPESDNNPDQTVFFPSSSDDESSLFPFYTSLYPSRPIELSKRNTSVLIDPTAPSPSKAGNEAEGISFAVEELLAMQIQEVRKMADEVTGKDKDKVNGAKAERVKDVVIAVPPYFTQFERRIIEDAVKLSGLRLLALINDGTAAAVNYAMTRTFPTPQYHLFYDSGSSGIRSTLVKFSTISIPSSHLLKNSPMKNVIQIEVLGQGWDLQAGGLEMDRRLSLILRERFLESQGGKDVEGNLRARAKLLKEAGKVKGVLSANTNTISRIEGLIDELDFRGTITRDEFEAACEDLKGSFTKPLFQALEQAGKKIEDLDSVVLIGGNSRVPMIQAAIREIIPESKIAVNLNADEAIVMGAALYGAGLSQQFRTKEIKVNDALGAEIFVSVGSPDAAEEKPEVALFNKTTTPGSKKTLVYRRTEDFPITFSQFDGQHSLDFLHAKINGIPSALAKANLTTEELGNSTVKVTAEVTRSGLVQISKAVLSLPEEQIASTPLTDKIKNFFGSKKSENQTEDAATQSEEEGTETQKRTEEETNNNSTNTSPPKPKRATTVTLQVQSQPLRVVPLSRDERDASKKKLRELEQAVVRKQAREESRNILEALVYRSRDLVELEEFKLRTTPEEITKVQQAADQLGEWIWDEGEKANQAQLDEKRASLENLIYPLTSRVDEYKLRPRAIDTFNLIILNVQTFLSSLDTIEKGVTSGQYTQHELDELARFVNGDQEWLKEMLKAQESELPNMDPVLRVQDLKTRGEKLESEMNRLKNKKRPRVKKSSSATTTTGFTASSSATTADSTSTGSSDPPGHQEL